MPMAILLCAATRFAVYRAADASKADAPEGIVCKIVGVKANRLVAIIEAKQLG